MGDTEIPLISTSTQMSSFPRLSFTSTMNQPKPIQIRLPFSVPRPNKSEASTSRICGICRKETSKYTCPRCNIAYCSLACFRDEKHSQCSEPFYRSTIISEIGNDDKASLEEKKAMLEMLKRFEEGAEGDLGSEELEEDEEDELSRALGGVDLESVDSNQLFKLLPPAHRDKFLANLRNPESEETKALLDEAVASEQPALPKQSVPTELPWFEEPIPNDSTLPYAARPSMISNTHLDGIRPPDGTGTKLSYNAIAIALAYLHTLLSFRLPSISSARLSVAEVTIEELQSEIGELAPFVVESRSTIRYESLRTAWSAVWDLIGAQAREAGDKPPLDALLRLLQSTSRLSHPTPGEPWPCRLVLLLSDLHSLWSKPKPNGAIPKKLAFYIAASQQLRMADWLRLESELHSEIEILREENGLPDPDALPETPNFLA